MTVRINKDAINLREKLSQLDKPSGLVGEELLRADTSADAREALNLEEHLFEDFESTGIDDNATSTVVTVSDSGLDVTGTVTADGLVVEPPTGNCLVNLKGGSDNSYSYLRLTSKIGGSENYTNLYSDYNASVVIQHDNNNKLATFAHNGDVSFYEDTGTTAKFVWDASAEKLTIDGSDNASSLPTAVTSSVLELNGNSGGSAASWFGSVSGGGQYVQSSNSSGSTSYDFLINPYGGNVGVGTASPVAKLDVVGDIKVSGGVYLGGTGSANKLDDYETGTWTPKITGSTTAGTHSSTLRGGEYVKVGRKVTVTFYYSGSSGTGSGELRLGGLPFLVEKSAVAGVPFANSGLVFNSGWTPAWILHSAYEFKIRAMDPTGGNFQPVAYSGNLSYFRGTLTYFTNQ